MCSWLKCSDDVFVTKFKVTDPVRSEGDSCEGLERCFFHLQCGCSLGGRSVGGICGIGNKLCWLLAACQSGAAVPGSRSLPERHRARGKNAVQGSLSSQNPRAVLASQLRVYGFVVCDVMRVLAFRNFTTEEAVWNAGRILETFEYALGFFLVSSEQRYRWIRTYIFF